MRAVIVGGGIIGLCTAWHLAEMGCRDVVVLERATVGAGSTGRASGGIRQQFARTVEVQMAVESVAFWTGFDSAFGAQLRFRQNGYLYLLTTPGLVAAAEVSVAMQRYHGAPSRMLSPAEIGRLVPEVDLNGVLAGSLCPTDGRAAPMGAVIALSVALRARGVDVREGVTVTGVIRSADGVMGVEVDGTVVPADVVINAAGPHAAAVARMAGLDLPVRAVRMHQFVTAPVAALTPGRPVLVEPSTTLFVAEEAGGALLGMRQEGAYGEHLEVDASFLPLVLAEAGRRIPALRDVPIVDAWAGLVEMSPDHVGIIGTVPELPGFVCANGLSGHGFMLAPAVGRIAAGYALGAPPQGLDLPALSPMRFRQ
jgi:sarcosine oxidase subunit beta